MKNENLRIRLEERKDYKETENIVRESFWNVYRPGCLEHYVLHVLRNDKDFVKELDFVLEKNGKIIGQNIFVKANIKCDDGSILPILTMGPISILPEFRGLGYGKMLLDFSLNKAKELGFGAVCIEGNYLFYSKSGFKYARECNLRYEGLPEGEDSSFFLCCELKNDYLKGVSGVYATPSGYMVDENKVDDFDKDFPKKKKLILEGQLFG